MRFIFRSGPRTGDQVEIDRELVVGREGADVEIEDTSISRRHAILRPVEDGVEVEDLDSTNGTFVNGSRINRPHRLQHGDFINLGQSTFEIEEDWRSAQTEAISVPTDADDGEPDPYLPTSEIVADSPDRGSLFSNMPRSWLFIGAGVAALILVLAFVLFTSGDSSRGEFREEADAICRKAAGPVRELALSSPMRQGPVRQDARRILRARSAAAEDLQTLEAPEEVGESFLLFIERFRATNRFLQRLEGLKDPNNRALRRGVADVRDAVRPEEKAARSVGLRDCGGLAL